jgi:NADPH-dependent ferric siderophore reductase
VTVAAWHAEVESTRWLTPALVRVVLTGEGLAGFEVPDATDTYVNIAVPPAGAPYGPLFEPAEVREQHPREMWPARRRYTVRSWDTVAGRLVLDFVVHGDEGVGGPWAAAAGAGDVLVFEGPGGGYRPDPAADWHLLVGDESATPAIAASLEAVPDDRPVVVRLLCDGPDHEVELPAPDGLDLQWLHRPASLPDAVVALVLPEGRGHAFVHGEADEIRAIRRHLLAEAGMARADMSCSPYWRRTMADEDWRAVKKDFVTAMEGDVA